MSIWKENLAFLQIPAPVPEASEPAAFDAPPQPEYAPSPDVAPVALADTGLPRQESLIAADITIEGKIEGGGSVRIAGKFNGDVNVQGDLTIEAGAKLTGGVRANNVTIAGELEGNVAEASHVDLLQTGVMIGDLKAGSLTVTAGARMRGQAEFGWDDSEGSKADEHSSSGESAVGRGRVGQGKKHWKGGTH
jgi:cytoskeletal protein CcmA (bactofilin family)